MLYELFYYYYFEFDILQPTILPDFHHQIFHYKQFQDVVWWSYDIPFKSPITKEKGQKDKTRSTKHTHKTKDGVKTNV